jgi:DNA-binding HxlR family transcriptional regulator
LVRRVLNSPPVGVEYELTESGLGFVGVMEAVSRWGEGLPSAKREPR